MGNIDAAVINSLVGALLIFLLVAVVVLLVLREVICWYWKINKNVTLLTEIRDLLSAKGTSQDIVAPAAQQSTQKTGLG